MSHIDVTYGRRAQQAAPAARTALDDLDASLSASPAVRARNEVAKESRAELERHLEADASRVDLATLRRLLHEKKQRFPPTAALRDGGLKIHLHLARLERYIQLRAQEEQWQQQQQQQQQHHQQQQQLLPEEPDGRSKRWLEVATDNAREAELAQSAGGLRQVVPAPLRPGRGSRDYSGLAAGNDVAIRGSQPLAKKGGLLAPSGAANQPRGRQTQAEQQRQQREPEPDSLAGCGLCEVCKDFPKSGTSLKQVMDSRSKKHLEACTDCCTSRTFLQPRLPPTRRQSTLDTSLAAITTQQRQQWQQQQQQQQQDVAARPSAKQQQQQKRGSLPLQRSIPPGAFHGSVSAAPIGPPSAVADVGGSGGGKRSKQGRAAQQTDDEDWQLPAGGGYESDFDWQDPGRGRVRRKCVRKPRASQAANAEPVVVDLLSDDDADLPPEALAAGGSGDAAAAGARPASGGRGRAVRTTRAKQYMSTSDRFKGLKCMYPQGGGAGAIEVTALDLPRLDADEFLNDTERLPTEVLRRCHFFNTFFFKKLTEEQGGVLPPDVDAWAKQEGMKGVKLQALRNHQKEDLFAKDFIFVPVHDALHWSLMVVCHPGVVMPPGGAKDSHTASRPDAPDGIPKRWAQQHPGQVRSFKPSEFPHKTLQVPAQDNHCDCGLFVCSYIEYFVHRLPPVVNSTAIDRLKEYAKTNRDLFEDTEYCSPGLLTLHWFNKTNPSHLRWEIRRLILRLMAEQGGLLDPSTGVWQEGSKMAEELQHELLQLDQKANKYVRPEQWEPIALAQKKERGLRLLVRAQQEEDKKAQRQRRQSGAAKSPGALGSSQQPRRASVDRELLARAAEQRIHSASSGGGGGGGGGVNSGGGFAGIISDLAAEPDSSEGIDIYRLPGEGRHRKKQRPGLVVAAAAAQAGQGARPEALQQVPQAFESLLCYSQSEDEGGEALPRPASQDWDSDFQVLLDSTPTPDVSAGEQPAVPEAPLAGGSVAAAAAAAAGSPQEDVRRSPTPELVPACRLRPEGLQGMHGSSLPGRSAKQRRKRQQAVESEEGEQVEAAAPYLAPQQQEQGPDASPFSKKELKRQRKQQQQQLQQQQQQQRHRQQEEAACVANPSHPHGKHTVFASSDEEGSKLDVVRGHALDPMQQLEEQQQQQGEAEPGNGGATAARSEGGTRRTSAAMAALPPRNDTAAAPVAVAQSLSRQQQHQHHQQGPGQEPVHPQPAANGSSEDGWEDAVSSPVSEASPPWRLGAPVEHQLDQLHLEPTSKQHTAPAGQPLDSDARRMQPPAMAAAAQLAARQQKHIRQQLHSQGTANNAAAAGRERYERTALHALPAASPAAQCLTAGASAAGSPHAPAVQVEQAYGHEEEAQLLSHPQERQGSGTRKRKSASGHAPSGRLSADGQQQEHLHRHHHQRAQQLGQPPLDATHSSHPVTGGTSSPEAAAADVSGQKQRAAPEPARIRQSIARPTSDPGQRHRSEALRLFHSPHAATTAPSPQPAQPFSGASTGTPPSSKPAHWGQPAAHNPRYAVSPPRNSPRLSPPLGVGAVPALVGQSAALAAAAAAAAVDAEAGGWQDMEHRRRQQDARQLQQRQQDQGCGGLGRPIGPSEVAAALLHVSVAPSTLNGAAVKQLGSVLSRQKQQLSQQQHSKRRRPGNGVAQPSRSTAAVDLTGDE
ncbi:Ubiquitin-like-specific protease 2 [Chlorella vulgaris]